MKYLNKLGSKNIILMVFSLLALIIAIVKYQQEGFLFNIKANFSAVLAGFFLVLLFDLGTKVIINKVNKFDALEFSIIVVLLFSSITTFVLLSLNNFYLSFSSIYLSFLIFFVRHSLGFR